MGKVFGKAEGEAHFHSATHFVKTQFIFYNATFLFYFIDQLVFVIFQYDGSVLVYSIYSGFPQYY